MYDEYGRPIQLTESIPSDQSFTTSFAFDNWNNNTSITYPSGLTITNLFDKGYLTEIRKDSLSTIWKLDSLNSRGQPLKYSFGDSGTNLITSFAYNNYGYLTRKQLDDNIQTYNFDTLTGNLLNRSYNIPGMDTLSESFGYNDFSLTRTTVSGQPSDTISYDLAGNISYKSDIGDYRYAINRLDSIIAEPTAIPLTDQSLTYTAENMTESVTQNDGRHLHFLYGPWDQRIRSVLTNESDTVKVKYYSGSYEKVITDSCTREYNYINSPVGPVAVIIEEGETETVYYLETDHLGSIIGILNTNGTKVESFSYDAWGRRRNPINWSYDSIPEPTLVDRGFTGHEHIDEFGLINMNGRMYDPYIGRFLSVDPVIQFPGNVLSFNGYGYCLNNPLIYADPSGYLLTVSEAFKEARAQGYSGTFTSFQSEYMEQYFNALENGSGGGKTIIMTFRSVMRGKNVMNDYSKYPYYCPGEAKTPIEEAKIHTFLIDVGKSDNYTTHSCYEYDLLPNLTVTSEVRVGVGQVHLKSVNGSKSQTIEFKKIGPLTREINIMGGESGTEYSLSILHKYLSINIKEDAISFGLGFTHGNFSFGIESRVTSWQIVLVPVLILETVPEFVLVGF